VKAEEFHLNTKAVHGKSETTKKSGPVVTPIFQTSTFQVPDIEEQSLVRQGDRFYTRYGNPTHTAAEETIAAMEGAEAALLFASGMTAITTSIIAVIKSGDHIVAQRELYGGAFNFLSRWMPRFGVETTFVEATNPDQFAQAIRPNTRLIYIESPTNPTLKIVDIERVVEIARQHGIPTFIDNTFATPINQRPIELGVDVVIHSGTKYLAGHSDLICGVVLGSRRFIADLRETRITFGGIMDPHASWLLLRGLKTLGLRVERHNQNALQVAQFLEQHPRVKRVYYPFLESHSQYALAKKQMTGGGGVLSFEIDGTAQDARRFIESLKLFALAPSLGSVESLSTIPAITSHARLSPEERASAGITDQLVRLAVGIEQVEDLITDVQQALNRAA